MSDAEYQWELDRQTRLVSELEKARKIVAARQVKIPVSAEVRDQEIASLPSTIHLSPTELRIEFRGVEDLLRQMLELSHAIMNDYRKFEVMCESLDV